MAFDAFLKIEGIPGESTDVKHKNEIDVMSFSFAVSRKNERGRPQVSDFTVVKKVDAASPLLFDKACQGDSIDSAMFTARKAGKDQLEFLKIKFEDIIISSIQPAGAAGTDALPLESLSLNYQKVEIEYVPQKDDGSAGGSIKSFCTTKKGRDAIE